MSIKSINPADGKIIKIMDEMTRDEVNHQIDLSFELFHNWKNSPVRSRAGNMLKAAQILRNEKMNYARILTTEMGKPIRQAVSEVEKCAWVCEYYAENTERILQEEIIKTDASESYVRFDPLGVVLAVMPWNFPFWQVFRFAAPALMAGNTGLLKHSSNVPMSALAIEEIFMKAGFPQSSFKTLLIGSALVEDIIKHPKVSAVTLTGSEDAGKKIAAAAGRCLKKTVLELGGSDPFIVLADADIEQAAKTAVQARIINNGQSCIAAKRFIVVEEVMDKFQNLFVKHVKELRIGDPMDESNDLGPMAREDLLNDLDRQIRESVKMGAKVLTGGKRLEMSGYYYPATVISGVKRGMPVYEEETFGPAAAIIAAKSDNEAIRIANDTPYGLGASLWTRDMEKAKKMAQSIDAGSVFINGMVKSDPRLPFGGIKISGYGRELSHYGIKEFLNIKTVWIA